MKHIAVLSGGLDSTVTLARMKSEADPGDVLAAITFNYGQRHLCELRAAGRIAPELGNVMIRWGVQDDPVAATEALKTWMDAMPTGIEGRRQMPQFNLTDEEYQDLANFLIWTSKINTQGWPPNEAG